MHHQTVAIPGNRRGGRFNRVVAVTRRFIDLIQSNRRFRQRRFRMPDRELERLTYEHASLRALCLGLGKPVTADGVS